MYKPPFNKSTQGTKGSPKTGTNSGTTRKLNVTGKAGKGSPTLQQGKSGK